MTGEFLRSAIGRNKIWARPYFLIKIRGDPYFDCPRSQNKGGPLFWLSTKIKIRGDPSLIVREIPYFDCPRSQNKGPPLFADNQITARTNRAQIILFRPMLTRVSSSGCQMIVCKTGSARPWTDFKMGKKSFKFRPISNHSICAKYVWCIYRHELCDPKMRTSTGSLFFSPFWDPETAPSTREHHSEFWVVFQCHV